MTTVSTMSIDAAIDVANEILTHLENAHKNLISAKKWGVFDILGGKLIATAGKHEQLELAQKELTQAVSKFALLKKLVSYYDYLQNYDLKVNDISMVMDYLFDNPITDFITQSKIKNNIIEVEDGIAQMHVIIEDLYRQETEAADELLNRIDELKKQRAAGTR